MEDLIINDAVAKELLDKASKIVQVDYSKYTLADLIDALDNLILEVESLNDEIAEINQDIEDNYRHISKSEEIEFNPHDML